MPVERTAPRWSRRRVLLVALGAAAALAALPGLRAGLARLRRITDPALPDASPAPLPGDVRAALLAAVDALVGPPAPAERERYARVFEARARMLRGYGALYRRFARAADRRARAAGAPGFAAAAPALRRRVLAEVAPSGGAARLRSLLVAPERPAFRRYVVGEILALYAFGGAWRALGYEAAPGPPRGLEAYTGPPPGASGAEPA